MKTLVDLKKELLDNKTNNLYVFVGEENLIRKIYYNKVAEIRNTSIKYLDDVSSLFKELEKKSLFTRKLTYVVYNDLLFLKQKSKTYERLLKLINSNAVILVYDELPEKGDFINAFDGYITIFNYVTTDIAIKYVNKESKNHKISEIFAKQMAFNCFNSYNYIVEEMNKYTYLQDSLNDDSVDAIRYAMLFTSREEIPTSKEFANAFITKNWNLLANYYRIIKQKEANILAFLPELYNTISILLFLKLYGKWEGGSAAYNSGEYWGRVKELREMNIVYTKNDLLDIRYLVNLLDLDVRSGRMKAEYAWEWLIGVIL